MNDLQMFNNEEFGQIRTVMIDGEPWLVGKDVTAALGYGNASKALSDHVDEEDKLNNESLLSLGQRGGWLINESGVYSLIFGSKLESAKRFKHWVTSEVLPTLRKTGTYTMPGREKPDDGFLGNAGILNRLLDCEPARLMAIRDIIGWLKEQPFEAAVPAQEEKQPYEKNEPWTAEVKARMHSLGLDNAALSQECGFSSTYLSTVLNGNKVLSEKGKASTRGRIMAALRRIEERKRSKTRMANGKQWDPQTNGWI